MSRVRIFIDGIEHSVDKKMFSNMMYAAENSADLWHFNNSITGNDDLASLWLAIGERSRELKAITRDSMARDMRQMIQQ